MTGLALILTGAWDSDKTGAELTTYAFDLGVIGEEKEDVVVQK